MIESNPYRRALKESRSKFHFVLQFNFIIFDYFQKKKMLEESKESLVISKNPLKDLGFKRNISVLLEYDHFLD